LLEDAANPLALSSRCLFLSSCRFRSPARLPGDALGRLASLESKMGSSGANGWAAVLCDSLAEEVKLALPLSPSEATPRGGVLLRAASCWFAGTKQPGSASSISAAPGQLARLHSGDATTVSPAPGEGGTDSCRTGTKRPPDCGTSLFVSSRTRTGTGLRMIYCAVAAPAVIRSKPAGQDTFSPHSASSMRLVIIVNSASEVMSGHVVVCGWAEP
jgi:hypothetical protein